jgi:hypothetical protein
MGIVVSILRQVLIMVLPNIVTYGAKKISEAVKEKREKDKSPAPKLDDKR